jgi:hypothetical protein
MGLLVSGTSSRRLGPGLMLLLVAASAGCHTLPEPARPPAGHAIVPDAVYVTFRARSNSWSVRRADDSFVCRLPCSLWVGRKSGLGVRLEKYSSDDEPLSFKVPAELPARPGELLTIEVDRQHGLGTPSKYVAAPLAVVFGIMGAAFATGGAAALISGRDDTTSQTSGTVSSNGVSTTEETETHGDAASISALAFGVGALAAAGLCVYWYVHDRDAAIEFGPPRRLAPADRSAAAAARASAVRITLSPAGISGRF